jgi:hypothetical protein
MLAYQRRGGRLFFDKGRERKKSKNNNKKVKRN